MMKIKYPNQPYCNEGQISPDEQDENYFNFQIMKYCIANPKMPMEQLEQFVRREYNRQSQDVMDHYLLSSKKKKVGETSSVSVKITSNTVVVVVQYE